MMRSFAEAFFQHFGARLQAIEEELIVDLPPELAATFGKSRLYLVFPQASGEARELSPTEDLLVYGSRIFDQMLSLLAGRGEMAHFYFPERNPLATEARSTPPLPLSGCQLLASQVQVSRDLFYIFNFRATYISDEKQEEFVTVILDETGTAAPGIQKLLDHSGPDLNFLNRSLQVEPGSLRQISARAAELAQEQLQSRVTELEQAIKPRLERVLLRLTSYYRRLLAEINSGDEAQDEAARAGLQQDLAGKIAEELERHRLRVRLTPVSLAIASMPRIHYQLHLATSHTQQEVRMVRELVTGQLEPLPCYYCSKPLDHLSLCDHGHHAVHQACSTTCHRCGRTVCFNCGVKSCTICLQSVCVNCRATCAYCDCWVCAQHIGNCAICGAAYCPTHSFRCTWCHQTYCHQCGGDQTCQTCRSAIAAPLSDVADLPTVAGLSIKRFSWKQAENKEFNVYIGHPKGILPLLGWRQVILVTTKTGLVIYWRKRGWLERLKQG